MKAAAKVSRSESASANAGPRGALPPRGFWFLAAGAVATAASIGALIQPLRPDPSAAPVFPAPDWWLQPSERNAFQRLPTVTSRLNSVYALPGSGHVWAVGDGGLLLHSPDDGRSWQQDSVLVPPERDTTALTAPAANRKESPPDTQPPTRQRRQTNQPRKAEPAEKGAEQYTPPDSSYDPKKDPKAQQAPVLGTVFPTAWLQAPTPTRTDVLQPRAPRRGDQPQTRGGLSRVLLNFHDAFFLTPTDGWVVGAGGLIAHTADGGASWSVDQAAERGTLVEVIFADSGNGSVLNQDGKVLDTFNGGRSWDAGESSRVFNGASIADSTAFLTTREGVFVHVKLADRAGEPVAGTPPVSTMSPVPLDQISFIDSKKGWATDTAGHLWLTSDVGQQWTQVNDQADLRLGEIAFTDGSGGWAVSRAGSLLRTSDGGANWRRELGRDRMHALSFGTSRTGFAVGERGRLLETRDGGRSWTPRRLDTVEDLVAVRFFGPDTGLIVEAAGRFWRSVDGGREWTADSAYRQALPSLEPERVTISGPTTALSLIDDKLHRRGIGEATWQGVSASSDRSFLALSALDPRRVLGVTPNGDVAATSDGGATWRSDYLPVPPRPVRRIFVVDSLRASAQTGDGTVLQLRDRGRTWFSDTAGTRVRLQRVTLLGDSLAWGISAAGSMFGSSDGGTTWAELAGHRRGPAPWYWASMVLVAMLLMPAVRGPAPPPPAESVADLLVSDRPIRRGDPDPLDFTSVALGLSRFIRNSKTEPPLTIAVTGQWGTGKSSLMNLLQDDLRQYGFRPIWFNAWHHQKEEHLLASLLQQVQANAAPPFLHPGGFRFRLRLLWYRARRYWLIAAVALPVFAMSFGYLASDWTEQPARVLHGAVDVTHTISAALQNEPTPAHAGRPDGDVADKGSLLAFLLLLLSSSTSLWKGYRAFGGVPATLMTTMKGAFRLKDLKAQTGFRSQFETEFREVTRALGSRRMVILVDDLDRCRPDNVLEVLEAINFLVSSGDCFVLLGMDRDFVEGCVGIGFKHVAEELAQFDTKSKPPVGTPSSMPGTPLTPEERGRKIRRDFAVQYLEKLINIEVPVPPASALQLGKVISGPGTRDLAAERRRTWRRRATWGTRISVVAIACLVLLWLFDWGKRTGTESLGAAPAGRESPGRAAPASGDVTAGSQPFTEPRSDGSLGPPGYFVPGTPAPTSRGLLAIGVVLIGAAGLIALLRRPTVVVHDSKDFTEALNVWSSFVYTKRKTPRAIKKFLNRVRFYAMRQQAHRPPETRWERITKWLNRQPVLRTLLGRLPAQPSGPDAAPAENRAATIPEEILVALSSIQECRAEWLDRRELFADFPGFLEAADATEPLPESVQQEMADFREWGPLVRYQEKFAQLTAGLRTG